jgi:dephospho-CoA kinase
MSSKCLDRLAFLLKRQDLLFVGLTGGIASGKSTVAAILEAAGALTFDMDAIARQVVEPGKPAWQEVVDDFGPDLLREDRSIDRKKLAQIVFQDKDKRKRLEAFTHERILEEYLRQAGETAERTSGAVIQAVVPLLLELKLQPLFHKVVLVYTPYHIQVSRLCARDAVGKEQAARMLEAQLLIDEKVEHADFVINNAGSLEDTRRQTLSLWKTLTGILHNRIGSWG